MWDVDYTYSACMNVFYLFHKSNPFSTKVTQSICLDITNFQITELLYTLDYARPFISEINFFLNHDSIIVVEIKSYEFFFIKKHTMFLQTTWDDPLYLLRVPRL